MRKELVKLSKFLSLVLRHKPQTIGLTLDKNGWADVQELLDKCLEYDGLLGLSMDVLEEVVETNDKKRFAFNEDKTKIRASQGHSLKNVDLGLEPKDPPFRLYHGTSEDRIKSIKEKGLVKGNRQHVHLSLDFDTAVKVGKRHGKPQVLFISSDRMVQDGYKFYLSDNNVWLTDHVPVKYIKFGPYDGIDLSGDVDERIKARYSKHDILLQNIKDNMEELEKEWEVLGNIEDEVYRFYHHSFKVYRIQQRTLQIVELLLKISPHENPDDEGFCHYFEEILYDGTIRDSEWELKHNERWTQKTRPKVEAFFHAKYFLQMAIKYGKKYDEAPKMMDSGWAALTELYDIR